MSDSSSHNNHNNDHHKTPHELFDEFLNKAKELKNRAEALDLKSKYLGKNGPFSTILKSLKDVAIEVKKEIGQQCNTYKDQMELLIKEKLEELEMYEMNRALEEKWIDITLRNSNREMGLNSAGLHPVSIVQREIEDIFISMGFEVLDGPYIEDDHHNFTALNVPADHPARDMQDTFWFPDKKHLLRTHTSTIQVHGMEMHKPPFKFVGPGKVFRCERTDASHEMVFHQLEGMMVDKGISVSHLIYFMKTLLSEIFRRDVDVRLRPGFFPFVEPGFELDIKCLICQGKGCSVCKKLGWVELLPCGMVHPNVLRAGKIDPSEYQGFAFGLGLDRLVMMRYVIDDIRLIHAGDLRFISQFKAY
ncbi:MAG: phenylalanine--tRNA ligase subunit alpha [Oligoflexia bacterium]|nr:phenylalanine--tRNA ligase subunit alpha [Oligoflexia bacterium]MBF0366366.1 phenylalanine--tRNA ligase subunit alpha [Oligoflexia bacterium]